VADKSQNNLVICYLLPYILRFIQERYGTSEEEATIPYILSLIHPCFQGRTEVDWDVTEAYAFLVHGDL